MSAESFPANEMVDLQRYPIADLATAEGSAFAESCREQYLETGLCMLHGFIKPNALANLADEAGELSDRAYFCKSTHNAYLTEEGEELDGGDVRARQEETYVGSVAYDLIPENAALKRLYTWDPLRDFIGAVLGKPKNEVADQLGISVGAVYVARCRTLAKIKRLIEPFRAVDSSTAGGGFPSDQSV